jgi:hypothetical protein
VIAYLGIHFQDIGRIIKVRKIGGIWSSGDELDGFCGEFPRDCQSGEQYGDHIVGLLHFDFELLEGVLEVVELVDRILRIESAISGFALLVLLFETVVPLSLDSRCPLLLDPDLPNDEL